MLVIIKGYIHTVIFMEMPILKRPKKQGVTRKSRLLFLFRLNVFLLSIYAFKYLLI